MSQELTTQVTFDLFSRQGTFGVIAALRKDFFGPILVGMIKKYGNSLGNDIGLIVCDLTFGNLFVNANVEEHRELFLKACSDLLRVGGGFSTDYHFLMKRINSIQDELALTHKYSHAHQRIGQVSRSITTTVEKEHTVAWNSFKAEKLFQRLMLTIQDFQTFVFKDLQYIAARRQTNNVLRHGRAINNFYELLTQYAILVIDYYPHFKNKNALDYGIFNQYCVGLRQPTWPNIQNGHELHSQDTKSPMDDANVAQDNKKDDKMKRQECMPASTIGIECIDDGTGPNLLE